ncbi:GATA zinc finger domain-containing protein 10-like [Rhagoletis pomonella]|uniref:GATA zinc finger domain-containing protein 10-like n=1 Tax=Rhagoletis pomonella TaxID=28610 RepID=UPI0017834953|nr:GATA zinc finger domain-containing protein 10-like [Rhagoletis pomonella]
MKNIDIDSKISHQKYISKENVEVEVNDQPDSAAGGSEIIAGASIGSETKIRDKQVNANTDHSVIEITKPTAGSTTTRKTLYDGRPMQLDHWTPCIKKAVTGVISGSGGGSSNNNNGICFVNNNNSNELNLVCCNNTNNSDDGLTGNKLLNEDKELLNVARRLYAKCSENNEVVRLPQYPPIQLLQQQGHLRPQPHHQRHQRQVHHAEYLQSTPTLLFYNNQQQQLLSVALPKPQNSNQELASLRQQYQSRQQQQTNPREYFLQQQNGQVHGRQVLCLEKNAPTVETTYTSHDFGCYDSPTPTKRKNNMITDVNQMRPV